MLITAFSYDLATAILKYTFNLLLTSKTRKEIQLVPKFYAPQR
jgi:hypothetical protein